MAAYCDPYAVCYSFLNKVGNPALRRLGTYCTHRVRAYDCLLACAILQLPLHRGSVMLHGADLRY